MEGISKRRKRDIGRYTAHLQFLIAQEKSDFLYFSTPQTIFPERERDIYGPSSLK